MGMTNQESAEFAIANVQCLYDSSDAEAEGGAVRRDHTYGARDEPPAFLIQHVPGHGDIERLHENSSDEPPAFIIRHNMPAPAPAQPFVEVSPKIMTISPSSYAHAVNVIHVGDRPQVPQSPQPEYSINKRIRRSEVVLRQAADCVSRGLTFQTVSEQFNIPISTIRFFMARKGILPRRRRGRSAQLKPCSSPEPPFHMQHFKLPDMLALRDEADDDASQPS